MTASPPSTALASTTASSPPTAPVSTSAPALTTVSPPPTAGSSSTTESPPTQGTPVVPTTPPTPATAPTTAPPLVTAATTASTAAAATTDASSSGSPPTLTAYSGDGFLQRSRLEGGGPLEALQTPLQSPSPPPGLAVTVEVDKLPRLPGATATEATTLADAKVTPTATLFNLAENVISGFAVMVLQSQVHVDEPGAVDGKHADQKANHLLEDLVFKPEPMHFATPNNTVVLAQRGTTAYLPCVIKNIADGLVTWLRRRDHHLLTVARGGYAQDERFQVVHDKHPEDWTMQLKFVTDRDTGRYECQVSTHPPVSIYIHLKVVEARCAIEGPVEKFVRSGSQLRLVCHIDQCTTEPEFMFWYKDGIMVNFDQHNVYQLVIVRRRA
ncbi:hypothetical protein FOCC_FOCC001624 [Frankliniella occidentalis]|nr:hypothetical protein FOCC_FOCC001624 [Frankliniella occidentalis]